jgi:hypothetical protein
MENIILRLKSEVWQKEVLDLVKVRLARQRIEGKIEGFKELDIVGKSNFQLKSEKNSEKT